MLAQRVLYVTLFEKPYVSFSIPNLLWLSAITVVYITDRHYLKGCKHANSLTWDGYLLSSF